MLNILTKLVATNAARYGEREAFSCQYPGSDEWVPTSWNELRRQSEAAACALETLGVEPQEMLAIFASNCPEILVTDFGAYANRAVPVSIYSTSSPEQVSYIVRDAGARIIFVGEQRHYDAARSIAAECPTLERIVCFDPEVSIDADDATTMRWADFIALGEAASQMCREAVAARSEAATPDDIFTLIYTSGTTGEPKGAVLPHSCMNAAVRIHTERLTMLSDSDTSLCFLPLSHIFEKAWTYFCLFMGIRVAINRDPREVQHSLRQVRPTCMCSVPRFWEKVYAGVQDKIGAMTGITRWMVDRALRVGARRNLHYARLGRKAPWMLAVIVSPHHGRPFHENLVLLADAHLHIGHHGAHRAHFPSCSRIAAHGGRSLAQAIAHYNVYAACVQKFHDIVAERRSGCRKYVAIVDSDDTAHGREHFFVEKSVLAFEHPRRFSSEARIVKIPAGCAGAHRRAGRDSRERAYRDAGIL